MVTTSVHEAGGVNIVVSGPMMLLVVVAVPLLVDDAVVADMAAAARGAGGRVWRRGAWRDHNQTGQANAWLRRISFAARIIGADLFQDGAVLRF